MRRVLASFIAIGLVTTVVTGCGGSEKSGHRVSAAVWAGQVCQALSPWRARITELNQQASTQMRAATTPEQARASLLTLLDGARQASEDARAEVAAAGVPDVPDGAAIAARFVAALAAMRDAYAKAQRTISALSTADADAFYAGVGSAVDALNDEYAAAGLDTGKLASATLRQEFAEVPACG